MRTTRVKPIEEREEEYEIEVPKKEREQFTIKIDKVQYNGLNLCASGTINGVWWTASKCHPNPHIQWSPTVPGSNDSRDRNAEYMIAVQRYLVRNMVLIDEIYQKTMAKKEIKETKPIEEEVKITRRRKI